jgi:hypothetical protein
MITESEGNTMKEKIYFDMDGTIANLYGDPNWLPKLMACDPTPYVNATPLVNMSRLAKALHKAQRNGYTIGVISWLSKNSTCEYDEAVTLAKLEWLNSHLPSVEWDEIHIVAYGTPKSTVADAFGGILFDDEEQNRVEWNGMAYTPDQIFDLLADL